MKNVTQTITHLGFTLLFGLISSLTFAEGNAENSNIENKNTNNSNVESNVPKQTPQQTVVQTPHESTPTQNNNTALNPNLVNINSASAAEIQDKLLGIGEKKAQAIVDYRQKNGNFIDIEQLTEVSGIGKATLEKNRNRIILE